MAAKGAVACGHAETAAAAAEILEEGGTAFDAVLAAMASAVVAEPVLASFAGGGFLLARPSGGGARLYDFFVNTPLKRRDPRDIDFYPVLADFGTATQEFHIGLGAMATPGAIAGFFKIHEDLASLPVKRLMAPAVRSAREGFAASKMDHFLYNVVKPILLATEETRAVFADKARPGEPVAVGATLRQPHLAEALEHLAEEGEALFYDGDWGRRLTDLSASEGGHLTQADLEAYQVEVREPLEFRYRGAGILTNPPPSAGGILIAFALGLLNGTDPTSIPPLDHLRDLARATALTNKARIETKLHEAVGEDAAKIPAERLFDPDLVARYRESLLGRPFSPRGTTHISVADRAGNLAALTLSNGEGTGRFLPGTGIILNNMLGEEDLNPAGFHNWYRGVRLASMMAPTLAFMEDGRLAALGSGGSNRIRSAVGQALMQLIDKGATVEEAVSAPRLHVEGDEVNFEEGFLKGTAERLAMEFPNVRAWPGINLFFGGVHGVTHAADGTLQAAGDARRGGVARVV